MSLTRRDLTLRIAREFAISNTEAKRLVDGMFDLIADALGNRSSNLE